MTLYRVQPHLTRMQRFRSIAFSEHYREADLETWLEQNPTVITDGEPILLIARQPPTPSSGTPDLIGLDADGNVVVIELKQGRTPRDVLAQALEYAAWVDGLTEDELEALAEGYLTEQTPALSLAAAWRQAFEPDDSNEEAGVVALPEGVRLNTRQRIILVVEGLDERLEAVVRYLGGLGVDVNLISYRYYKIEGGEEILELQQLVSPEQITSSEEEDERPTVRGLLRSWSEEGAALYQIFHDRLLAAEPSLVLKPTKTAISFYKPTRDGRVFLCYFNAMPSRSRPYVSFRADTLEPYVDLSATLHALSKQIKSMVEIREGKIWYTIHFPFREDLAHDLAEFISEEIAARIQ